MKTLHASLSGVFLALFLAVPAHAQFETAPDDPFAAPVDADPFADMADPVDDFSEVIRGERAVLRALNKVTAHTEDHVLAFGEPLQFGSLLVTAHYCSRRPPELIPETFVFLEIHDTALEGVENAGNPDESGPPLVFSGWMLGSSPALHGLEHPVYDIWPVACQAAGDERIAAETAQAEEQAARERVIDDSSDEDEVFLD